MMIHPGDENNGKAESKSEHGWCQVLQRLPYIICIMNGYGGWDFNIYDQEGQGNCKNSIAKSF